MCNTCCLLSEDSIAMCSTITLLIIDPIVMWSTLWVLFEDSLCSTPCVLFVLQILYCSIVFVLQTHVYKRMPRMHVKFGLLNQTCPFWTHLLTLKTFGLSGEASKAKNLPITWTLSEIHFRSTLDHAGLGFDWCCVYSIIRNSLEAWLKTLFTRILLGGRSRCI